MNAILDKRTAQDRIYRFAIDALRRGWERHDIRELLSQTYPSIMVTDVLDNILDWEYAE